VSQFDLPAEPDTPALVVDLDRLDRNIGAMSRRMAERGVLLRPHAKTHKSLDIARRQLAAGATGLTVATIGEAEVFADGGIEDLFIAFPVWAGGPKAARLRRLAERTRLRVAADSVAGVRLLAACLAGTGAGLLIELDSGNARSGVTSAPQAAEIADTAASAGLDVIGVFTHGGHSYNGRAAVRPAADDEVEALASVARELRAAGHAIPVLSAGSTPTAPLPARGGVTEERPGTYVFNDRTQAALGACGPDDVALMAASTVVSRSGRRFVLDAGAKVLSKDLPPWLDGYGMLPAYPDAVVARLYDHHAVVAAGDGPLPELGEVVAVVPNHVCPVVDLADEILLVRQGRLLGRWAVHARGRSR
jgi:D-serine deaminase-like pyridoxal phosphate-dependent protein